MNTSLGQINFKRGSHVGAFKVLHNGFEVAEIEQAIRDGKRKWVIVGGQLQDVPFDTREDAARRLVISNDVYVR